MEIPTFAISVCCLFTAIIYHKVVFPRFLQSLEKYIKNVGLFSMLEEFIKFFWSVGMKKIPDLIFYMHSDAFIQILRYNYLFSFYR